MFNLERSEKGIIIFLTAALLIGLGVAVYEKARLLSDLRIERASPDGVSGTDSSAEYREKININYAEIAELRKLKGVGPALAGRIVAYRSSHGPFSSAEDIKSVKGIGPSLYEKIKDSISVE